MVLNHQATRTKHYDNPKVNKEIQTDEHRIKYLCLNSTMFNKRCFTSAAECQAFQNAAPTQGKQLP